MNYVQVMQRKCFASLSRVGKGRGRGKGGDWGRGREKGVGGHLSQSACAVEGQRRQGSPARPTTRYVAERRLIQED